MKPLGDLEPFVSFRTSPNTSRMFPELLPRPPPEVLLVDQAEYEKKSGFISSHPSLCTDRTPASEFILKSYDTILNSPIKSLTEIGKTIAIPHFSVDILSELCQSALLRFKSMPIVIHLNSPICVVGDIHGSLHDLIRIFRTKGSPFTTQYLFLGDYVDRGDFSIEVITLLFAFFCEGAHITLIRGNHEFDNICSKYGFQQEVQKTYQSTLIYNLFVKTFEFMPLVAIIDNEIFCVHGGPSKYLHVIEDLNNLSRPISSTTSAVVHDLVWSDPSNDFPNFVESQRGNCTTFGRHSVKNFFSETKMKLIVRAHQYVPQGYQENFSKTCLTVFSASSYSYDGSNQSSVLQIADINRISVHTFESIPRIPRIEAQFFSINRRFQKQRAKSTTLGTSYVQTVLRGSPNARQTKKKIIASSTLGAFLPLQFYSPRPSDK